jgi:superfamily II DNA/RNA helicase
MEVMRGLLPAIDIPDLWQRDAVQALRDGRDVIVAAPTGAGKTRIFELFIEGVPPHRRGQAVYTVPTRALANEKWAEWRARGWNVGIATGDVAENVNAPIVVATLETQRERLLSGQAPGMLVLDEYQMIADEKRGLNYELAIALAPAATRLLLLSGSVQNPRDIARWMQRLGRSVELVEVAERPVPLDEFPVERLPRVPRVEGFWQRLAAGVVAARLSPLLIFAPRRTEAEKIARKVADGLQPDTPISLDPLQEKLLGKDLAKLVRRRVAFHHSGLPYAARAGWIEPLAKNGHLHVIVATTGLAAGINFSVRSVLVAGTTYQDGPFTRELRPDELLQMFGRAGRRGLDETGFVLVTPQSARLHQAAPRRLQRINQIDWPTLLRVLERAEAEGANGIDRAGEACGRLFSRQSVPLGFERPGHEPVAPNHYGPTREELLNSRNEWQAGDEAGRAEQPLAATWARRHDRWVPALRVPEVVSPLGPGRLGRIRDAAGFRYGKEVTIGTLASRDRIRPAAWVRKALHLRHDEVFTPEEFLQAAAPLLPFQGLRPERIVPRGRAAAVQLAADDLRVPAVQDRHGRWLLDPPRRRVAVKRDVHYTRENGDTWNPPAGSAARAWRTLGLVDAEGRPTARGRVFSRFQAGEGLVVAAALEKPDYPVELLVCHLANLRGGPRFAELDGRGSDRLAMVSREAYGHVDFPGYLSAGLCEGYGEATWEAIEHYTHHGLRDLRPHNISVGDIERAILEWQSLLRHIVHAPDPRVPRWADLQTAAREALKDPQKRHAIDWSDQLPMIYRQRRVREAVVL